jgi:xyloglucan-specific exo-beta-1,4-glucanase
MRAFSTRSAILSIGVAALVAACGGSGSEPGTATPTAIGHDGHVGAAQASTWNSVKFGGGGYVTGLIYHPTSPNVLYARTDVGGAYRWNQASSSWTPITDGAGWGADSVGHCIESMATDLQNDQKVYLVAGCDGNGRLYISNDRGTNWTWVSNLPFKVKGNDSGRAIGERLKVDPNNPQWMWYASRQDGLYTSWDGGQNWYQRDKLAGTHLANSAIGVEQLMFEAPTTGGTNGTWLEYAAIAPDYANAAGLTSTLYFTNNGGSSWTPVAVPSNVAGYHIPHMVRSADGYYYVVFNKDAGPGAGSTSYLYKFGGSSHGNTWTQLNTTGSNGGGYGGVSIHGTGANTRIVLSVTGTWADWPGQNIMKLSDDNGATWREIVSQMPHNPNGEYWGWLDDVEIDPNNRDHIMYVFGGGVWETTNASSATPSWNLRVNNLEETVTMAIATPPAGASYKLINSAGDVGTWVQTDLATKATRTPGTGWSNGNSADMAWSDSQYIAIVGASNGTGYGYSSGDGGATWTKFASLPAGAAANTSNASNIAVTARNKAVFAPADSVPSYTTDNGAHWTATNLPALSPISGFARSYKLAADRKNPNKVYAYDSGGAWWGSPGKVYVSTDAGHTFTLSQGSVNANLRANPSGVTTMTVNPNAEGDIWLADGNTVYHSTDSGATWTKINNFASIWGTHDTWSYPDVQGASFVTLGKAAVGAPYSAAVYVVGVINGQWGVWQSDNAGGSWTRFNDDNHQFGGIGAIAGDWNTYGRLYVAGGARGIQYAN